jgi:hypothetical protein
LDFFEAILSSRHDDDIISCGKPFIFQKKRDWVWVAHGLHRVVESLRLSKEKKMEFNIFFFEDGKNFSVDKIILKYDLTDWNLSLANKFSRMH